MKGSIYKKIGWNTLMLYLFAIAKIIFPLITLPYLTRVLSVRCYGTVSYVKSISSYMQLFIDFGFIYSAVKDISFVKEDPLKVSNVIGDTMLAKIILSLCSFFVVLIMTFTVPILRNYKLFALLSFSVPMLSSFLLDFLFRGIEKMHIVSLVFCSMKTISTVLVLFFVKNDSHIFLIPIFDILGSLVAIAITWICAIKLGYKIRGMGIIGGIKKIKESFFYFTNSIASSAFGALNTVVIGILVTDLQQIAYWSVCLQLVAAVQALYAPISNGIYPYMVRNKNLFLIKKILLIFMPVVLCGTVFCYFCAPLILKIVSGEQYIAAAGVFRGLLPVLIMSFPVAILGLPTLGAIEKIKQVNLATIVGALTQILGLGLLAVIGKFSVFNIAILRNISEATMLATMIVFVVKYRKEFGNSENEQ